MGDETTAVMGRTRALMTGTDREHISGEGDVEDNLRYQAVSRVRDRIDELKRDVEVLDDHHPGLLAEVREAVCDDADAAELRATVADLEDELYDTEAERDELREQVVTLQEEIADLESRPTTDVDTEEAQEFIAAADGAVADAQRALEEQDGPTVAANLKDVSDRLSNAQALLEAERDE